MNQNHTGIWNASNFAFKQKICGVLYMEYDVQVIQSQKLLYHHKEGQS